ncbi:MAG: zinc-dependent alcohol dehydrogenase family protein [Spirochaetota bacterium]
MKVWVLQKPNGIQSLSLETAEKPIPKSGEVLVKMQTVGLNRGELMFMEGQYPIPPKIPSLIGTEGAGCIESIGADVNKFQIGQEVCIIPNFPMQEYGILSEYALVLESALVEKPKEISWTEASAIWGAYSTAYGGLVSQGGLNISKKQTVLISAANSSIGQPAIDIAKAHNATVIATCRSTSQKEFIKQYGADLVVATSETENWPQQVLEFTNGKGFDIAFDPIAGPFTSQLTECAGQNSKIIIYGILSLQDPTIPFVPMTMKNILVSGFLINHLFQDQKRKQETEDYLLPNFSKGIFKPRIAHVFDFEKVPQAFNYMNERQQAGKIIVQISKDSQIPS